VEKMAIRELLHKSKLNELEKWLEVQGYMILATSKNPYEVLRAKKDKDMVIIYCKADSKEHLSVMDKDYGLIRRFVKAQRMSPGKDIALLLSDSHCECGMAIDDGWKYCPECGGRLMA